MTKEYFEAISHESLVEMAVILSEMDRVHNEILKELSGRTCENCGEHGVHTDEPHTCLSHSDDTISIKDDNGKEEHLCSDFKITFTDSKFRTKTIEQPYLDGYMFKIKIENVKSKL